MSSLARARRHMHLPPINYRELHLRGRSIIMTNPNAEDTNSPAGPGGTDNVTSTHQQPQDHDAACATQQPLSVWA